MNGKLYVVATPIGNLEDITFRAVRILQEVDVIVAEDTRHTKILLDKYDIHKPLTSYHKFNLKGKTDYLIELLQQGKNLALVSDSGTPGISDPGYQVIRDSVERGIPVEVIPGASASLAALAVSGLPTDSFVFEGFLPRKPGKKRKRLELLKALPQTIIIYESPFRVIKTLEEIRQVMGERRVAVCRELTKKFEETVRGLVSEVIPKIKAKGEFVIVVAPAEGL